MSDGQKQAVTVIGILAIAVLLCGGLVAGAFLLFGGVAQVAAPSAPSFTPDDGVLITAVLPQSPAEQANLQPGHILLQLNDDTITSPELLTLMLANLPADAPFTLLVRDDSGTTWQTTAVRAAAPPYLGVEIVGLPLTTPAPTPIITPAITATVGFQLPIVLDVVPDSPASQVDLQQGDIVTAVDGEAILNGEELLNWIASKQPGDSVTLTQRRGEDTLERTAVLAPHPEDAERSFLGIEFQP